VARRRFRELCRAKENPSPYPSWAVCITGTSEPPRSFAEIIERISRALVALAFTRPFCWRRGRAIMVGVQPACLAIGLEPRRGDAWEETA
jgi:hypothetical protein